MALAGFALTHKAAIAAVVAILLCIFGVAHTTSWKRQIRISSFNEGDGVQSPHESAGGRPVAM